MNEEFSALAHTAKYLNKQSDSFHSLLTAIQHKIVKLGIGLEVWLNGPGQIRITKGSTSEEAAEGITIGFAKLAGSWCIAVHPVSVVKDVMILSGQPTPLLEAPRDQRVIALDLIPALVKRLKEEADAMADDLDAAMMVAQTIHDQLM